MPQQEIIEVDPSEISNEVYQDLTEELDIDSDYAEKYTEKLRINELVEKNPNKSNILTSTSQKLKSGYKLIKDYWNENTILANIVDIKVTSNDYIRLTFSHPNLNKNRSCKMEPNSSVLSNLMEYHSLDDPMKLVGKKAFIEGATEWNESSIKIPNNTSITGKLRYKLFSVINELDVKMPFSNNRLTKQFVSSIFLNLVSLIIGTAISGTIVDALGKSTLLGLPEPIVFTILLPFFISLAIIISTTSYLSTRFIIYVLSELLESDSFYNEKIY